MKPLYHVRGWMKFFGWLQIIIGIPYCIVLVGGIMIWMGLCLTQAAKLLESAKRTGNEAKATEAAAKLATYFKILGVMTAISFLLSFLSIGISVILALVAGSSV